MIDSNHTSVRRVLVTGAGSGTGAAAAELIARTHAVVLVGRRKAMLHEVAGRIRDRGGQADVVAFDLVDGSAADLIAAVGEITDLVLAAGLNAPRRSWGDHDLDEFDSIMKTNFTSVAHLITEALPMLRRSTGTVVVVSSIAAWADSPGAGVAYRASKTALKVLTETLNAQEALNGVRACHLCPGDIDTDFLLQRPHVPSDDARRSMLSPADVARAIAFVLDSPAHVRIDELVLSPLGAVPR